MRRAGESVKTSQHHSSTFLPRTIIATIIFTAVFLPSFYRPFLSWLWQRLLASSIYRASAIETILTATCYIVFEPMYTHKFGHNPQLRIDVRTRVQDPVKARPRLPKMRRPKKRVGELLIYVAPLLLLDFILIKKFAGVPINDIRVSGGYPPVEVLHTDFVNSSIPSSFSIIPKTKPDTFISPHFLLPTVHNFTLASPLQLTRALPYDAPSSRRLVLELMAAFFIYDALFFAIHIAFHRIRPLARIHNPHHTHAEIHPQVTNRLSITERLSLILLANFALNIIGSHVLTRTLFIPLFVYLLIEVHCGMDLDWGYHRLMPDGWGAGPRVHAEHHRTGSGSYAPFFRWWDIGLEVLTSKSEAKARETLTIKR